MTVLLLVLMIFASVSLSMIYGLGPFAHPSMIHWHMRARKLPKTTQSLIKFIAILIISCACTVLVIGEEALIELTKR